MENTKDIRVANIDPQLHKLFKTACAYYDIDMRKELIRHMQDVVINHQQSIKRKFKEVKNHE